MTSTHLSLRALLIQKSIKPYRDKETETHRFESFVNSEEYQTNCPVFPNATQFESFVNSEEYQTLDEVISIVTSFDTLLN